MSTTRKSLVVKRRVRTPTTSRKRSVHLTMTSRRLVVVLAPAMLAILGVRTVEANVTNLTGRLQNQQPFPTTVIAGHPRSGTSLMMQCMTGLGFTGYRDEIYEQKLRKRYGKGNNHLGFWEDPDIKEGRIPNHKFELFRGKALKVFADHVAGLPSQMWRERENAKLILIRRDVQSLTRSMTKMNANKIKSKSKEVDLSKTIAAGEKAQRKAAIEHNCNERLHNSLATARRMQDNDEWTFLKNKFDGLLIEYERLQKNPNDVMREIVEYLGLRTLRPNVNWESRIETAAGFVDTTRSINGPLCQGA